MENEVAFNMLSLKVTTTIGCKIKTLRYRDSKFLSHVMGVTITTNNNKKVFYFH